MDTKNIKDNEKAVFRIKEEIGKITNKVNHVYFFVIDTEGYASGSLAYIYHLAKFAKDAGYNVAMLYQTEKAGDEFTGVEGWLGKEYSSIPHYNIQNGDVEINPSDILFIPDIYSQIMNQTKKLPCKRIAIMQNYDYILAQMPYSAQWGDYGIFDVICNTKENANLLKSIFPYEHTTVIDPYIEPIFGETKEPKKLIVNVVAHNQDDVTRLVKGFYWKYEKMRFLTFRDLRGFSKEKFADSLREGFLTIWLDDPASFGYSALEAMRCGNIVFAKVPDYDKKWMMNKDGNGYNDSCIWFDHISDMHEKIMFMARGFLTDTIPAQMYDGPKETFDMYKEEDSKNQFITYLDKVVADRKTQFENLVKIGERENAESGTTENTNVETKE